MKKSKIKVCDCGQKHDREADEAAIVAAEATMSETRRPRRYGYGAQSPAYRAAERARDNADQRLRECTERRQILAVGPVCPLCRRPVLQYGQEAVPGLCTVALLPRGARWRATVSLSGQTQAECLQEAWRRNVAELAGER